MNDVQLLQEFVAAKDERSFRMLVDRYTPMVYGSSYRQLREANLAEDVTQTVFITLFRKAARINPHSQLAGWLLAATNFICKDAMKKANRRRRHEQQAGTEGAAIHARSHSARLQDISLVVDDALAQLAEPDRTAVALRYLQGMTFDEVASEMQTTPEAVRKRIARALDRVREKFQRQGITMAFDAIALALTSYKVDSAPSGLCGKITDMAMSSPSPSRSLRFAALAVIAVLIVAIVVAAVVLHPATKRATAASMPANPQKVKVGFLISGQQPTGPRNPPELFGWLGAQFAKRFAQDTTIERFGLFQASDRDLLPDAVKKMFPQDHTLDAADPQDLQKLDVIIAPAAWIVDHDVTAAIKASVSSGVGLLNIGGFGNFRSNNGLIYDSDADALNGVKGPHLITYFVSSHIQDECVVVADHPLLGNLKKETTITVRSLNGGIGANQGTPLIAAPNLKPEYDYMRESGDIKDPTAVVLYPLYVTHLGKGPIVVCNWAQRLDPPAALTEGTKDNFYDRCIQWLATESKKR